MDPLKALIAVACVAIIAAVGYYFWSEYQRTLAAEDAAHERSVASGCRQTLWPENRHMAKLREWCFMNNYITRAEYDAVENP